MQQILKCDGYLESSSLQLMLVLCYWHSFPQNRAESFVLPARDNVMLENKSKKIIKIDVKSINWNPKKFFLSFSFILLSHSSLSASSQPYPPTKPPQLKSKLLELLKFIKKRKSWWKKYVKVQPKYIQFCWCSILARLYESM